MHKFSKSELAPTQRNSASANWLGRKQFLRKALPGWGCQHLPSIPRSFHLILEPGL